MKTKRAEKFDLSSAFITPEQLAYLTELTERRHEQLADDGCYPPKVKEGWRLAPTVRGLLAHYRELAMKGKDGLRIEQEGYTRAKRELAEEELKVFRGTKIERAKVGPALRNAHLNMRAELQTKFENELGPKLPLLKPEDQMREIRNAVDAICDIFSQNLSQWYQVPPSNR